MKKIFTILGTTAALGGAVFGLAACDSADNNKETTTAIETTETIVIEETAETIVEETEKIDVEDIQKESETIPSDMAGSDI